MRVLFINKDYLTKNSELNESVDFDSLTPTIFRVQELKIRPLLGSNLYNLISAEISADNVSANNKLLLDNYILPAMVCYIMADGIVSMKWKYLNKGVIERNFENGNQISTSDLQFLREDWLRKATDYGELLIKYILGNINNYTAYNNNYGIDKVKPSNTALNCSIYIPSGRYTKTQPSENE